MRYALSAACILALAGCSPGAGTVRSDGPDLAAVQSVLSDIRDAVAENEPARAALHYWQGAIIVRPCGYIGLSPTIEEYYRTLSDAQGAIEFSPPTLIGVSRSRDLAYVLVQYFETRGDQSIDGASLMVFEREGENWVIKTESREVSVPQTPCEGAPVREGLSE